jgi:hypothetical protein
MTAAELVQSYVERNPGTLVTPSIVKAFGCAKHGAVALSESAIVGVMRKTLRPYARGVFVAAPKPLPRPQGQLL